MTFMGRYKNGVVVFDAPPSLPEGATVEVAPIATIAPPDVEPQESTWGEVLKDFVGKAKGLPADMARNHDPYIHGTRKR
jgi:hypothetical protein